MDKTASPLRGTGRAPASGPVGDSRAARVRFALSLLLVLLVAVVIGLGALAGVAALVDRRAVFVSAGFVGVAGVTIMGVMVATRQIPSRRRGRTRWAAAILCTGAGALTFGMTALVPMRDPRLPTAPVAGQRFWDLDTGSRIAYVFVPAVGDRRSTPIIFLHGGPGVPDMQGDAAYFGRLAADGFDVYVYDQVGSGRSSRLSDPEQYTDARHVEDLEAIRRQIGAERVVLIAHSWGARIAAGYLARYGEHVDRVVLSSPGPLPGTGDHSDAGLTGRLSWRQKLGVYQLLARPRALLGYTLLQINPRAAHAFAGDREMDARLDRIYNRSRPALHCDGAARGPELHGLGFYAYQYPQSAAASEPDPRPAMAAHPAPTLLLKGSCDYLSWSSAIDYRDALPNAQIVYLPGAGHNIYQDQPEPFLAAVRAFLTGQPLPVAPWPGDDPPPDYEGPA